MKKQRIHLQPLGGIAGDMFVAAILDIRPELAQSLLSTIELLNLSDQVSASISPHNDGVLDGMQFLVTETKPQHDHGHRHLSEIQELINTSGLNDEIKIHALSIFRLLAEAESKVHGIAVDKIAFHEVGALDSIIDIVSAAFLINALGETSWSCGPLPAGSGTIKTAHGLLPLPAPAVVNLLEGYPFYSDQHEGERITPTGAAILRYLNPVFMVHHSVMRLENCGTGFGQRNFKGMSNILRILLFQPEEIGNHTTGKVAVIEFELDDQTPEDLAVAIEQLRTNKSVHDVIQRPVYAKKGRIAQQVQILCMEEELDAVAKDCFEQTTTLGLRWYLVNRITLEREMISSSNDEATDIQVKVVERPKGVITAKAEIDEAKKHANTHIERVKYRNDAESKAIDSFRKKKNG